SSVYAAKFGRQGVMGLQNSGIQVERVGELETKDATRTRIKWYTGLALFGTLGLSRLKGVNGS
ncbi:MAG: phage major capsid protein, partial [Chloroflexia bacterium]|nr:phage major capsid protein [Chloroflexia bacterium]